MVPQVQPRGAGIPQRDGISPRRGQLHGYPQSISQYGRSKRVNISPRKDQLQDITV